MTEKDVKWRDGFFVTLCYMGTPDYEEKTVTLYRQILEREALLCKKQGKWTLQNTAIAQAESIGNAMRCAQNLLDEVVGLLFAGGTYLPGKLYVDGACEKGDAGKEKAVATELSAQIRVSREPDVGKCQEAMRKLQRVEKGVAARRNAVSFLKEQEQTLVVMYKLIEQMRESDPLRWKSMTAIRKEYPVLDDLCDYCNDCNRSGEHARHSVHTNRRGAEGTEGRNHQYRSVDAAWQAFRRYLVPWLCWEEMPKEGSMAQPEGIGEKEERTQSEDQALAEDVTQTEGMSQEGGKSQEDIRK